MNALDVCIRCRLRLSGQRFVAASQKQRSFISLQTPRTSTGEKTLDRNKKHRQANTVAKPQDDASRNTPVLDPQANFLTDLFTSTQREPPQIPSKTRYSNTVIKTPAEPHTGKNIALPSNGTNTGTADKPMSGPTRSRKVLPEVQALKDDIATVQRMMDEKIPVFHIWERLITLSSFQRRNGKLIRTALERRLLRKTSVFRNLILAVFEEKISRESVPAADGDGPSPATAVQTYDDLGLLDVSWWHILIWRLLNPILRSDLVDFKKSALRGAAESKRRISYLLDQVLYLWDMFTRPFAHHRRSPAFQLRQIETLDEHIEQSGKDMLVSEKAFWLGLPDQIAIDSTQRNTLNFTNRFFAFFPSSTRVSLQLPAAAAVTLLCLHLAKEQPSIYSALTINSSRFTHVLSQTILGALSNLQEFRSCLAASQSLGNFYDELNQKYIAMYHTIRGTMEEHPSKSVAPARLQAKERKVPTLALKLRRATVLKDSKCIIGLWDRYNTQLPLKGSLDEANAKIFGGFLAAFNAVGHIGRAIEVWNTMTDNGLKPTRYHWMAMLKGCEQARDLPSLHILWQRLKTTGLPPSNHAWTIYISALLKAHDGQNALRSIEEMSQSWKMMADRLKSEHSPVDPYFEHKDEFTPSIIPVNAAISGFLAMQRLDLAVRVLKWTIAHGPAPTTGTFNTFLRRAARNNLNEDIKKTLTAMAASGCKPDLVTFTILIGSVIGNRTSNFHQVPAADQQSAIERLLKDMDVAKVRLGCKTYATMLDVLLSSSVNNMDAAHLVLEHMATQGIRRTPHINTILATYYFQCEPPALEALEALWAGAKQDAKRYGAPIDHVFCDRMIEGYARINQREKMLGVLRKMPDIGLTPGFVAIGHCLYTLIRAEEWDLCEELVKDVILERGLLKLGVQGWKGETTFWNLVEELRARGLDMPERRHIGRKYDGY